MGKPCLDCNGVINGKRFDVETKAPGKELTPRQLQTKAELEAAGGKVFVIDGNPDYLEALEVWLSMQE
jgi:hypothetical protein